LDTWDKRFSNAVTDVQFFSTTQYNTVMYESAIYERKRVDHETMNGLSSSENEKSPTFLVRDCHDETSSHGKRILSRVDRNMRVS